ncbi:hypothetical protein DINM_005571 [Dirofilaria immitis]|nr:hypothetical protein [Dirofilaria immitis]
MEIIDDEEGSDDVLMLTSVVVVVLDTTDCVVHCSGISEEAYSWIMVCVCFRDERDKRGWVFLVVRCSGFLRLMSRPWDSMAENPSVLCDLIRCVNKPEDSFASNAPVWI